MSEVLFEKIANDLSTQGYCILENALSEKLVSSLYGVARNGSADHFKPAGIGRGNDHSMNKTVRSDSIHWIDGENDAEQSWLNYLEDLKDYLNRRLFLGLFSYESHFAHYQPGAFYEKHIDAFRGQSNRVLSLVTYLNDGWQASDGGELLIYSSEEDLVLEKVLPNSGTLVVFLSEEFPHEVLPASADRYSIASWFRVNSSSSALIDPSS